MSNLSKRSTIYFEPGIHQALKVKAAFSEREGEKEISYEALLNDLKYQGDPGSIFY